MKTEKKIEDELIAVLNKTIIGAEIIKHRDMVSGGIPDLSITWRVATTWVELKVLDWHEQLVDHIRPLQVPRLRSLSYNTNYRHAWLVAYRFGDRPQLEIYRPDNIGVYQEWTGDTPGFNLEEKSLVLCPWHVEDLLNPKKFGMILFDGHDHLNISRLIFHLHHPLGML